MDQVNRDRSSTPEAGESVQDAPLPLGDLRSRIVTQALETIGERGVEGLTMRTLARGLGYSPASLYLHFRSKTELLEVVAGIGFRELQEQLDAARTPGEPEQTLERSARAYLAFGLRNPGLYRAMFEWRPAPKADPPAAAAHCRRRLFAHCREAIASGIEQGRFRHQDPDAAVALYGAALHGTVHLGHLGGPLGDASTLCDGLVAERLAAVQAPGALSAGPAARCA